MRSMAFGAACWAALAFWGTGALAQENCGAELNYEDADIRAVVDEIAVRTGRTFVLDPSVQGRVTIKSPPNGGICPDEVWELFQAMLRANEFVATPIAEGRYRIVRLQEAARTGGVVGEGTGLDLVTQIIRLRYVDAREAAANLAQLIGNNGVVSPVRGGNSIIIVDTADNVQRLRRVLAELDRDPTIYRTISLNHASATDVSRVVTDLVREISEEQGNGKAVFSVVPVEASNSLLVRAEPVLMRRVETVIGELDRYGQEISELAVVYLSHADAEEMAALLTEVANKAVQQSSGDGNTSVRGNNRVTVSFHKPTNAIIINGDADIQRTLQGVIAKLDIRRPQVQVEAIIVDISDSLARSLGVQYFLTGNPDNGIPFTATNFSNGPNLLPAAGAALLQTESFPGGVLTDTERDNLSGDLAEAALTSLLGIQGAQFGGGLEIGDGNFFGGILTALQEDTESNVLSTPFVITGNNQTARLQVGQEIPITTGEAIGDNFSNAFRTVDREEVGVILEVTPQINEGDTVTLEITQEISSVAGPIIATSTDLITNKREIQTTTLVDSGDILVIGGLVDQQRSLTEEKVPLLGDIPGLGNLFRSTTRGNDRQNLMVFIRTTIIRDQATAQAATRKKLDYIRARDLLRNGDARSDIDRLIEEVTGISGEPSSVPLPDDPSVIVSESQ